MSRSRRKTPIHGRTTCASEADDKRLWHKRFRVLKRQDIEATDERLVSDPWGMGKDGKRYWSEKDRNSSSCTYRTAPYKCWIK